MAAMDDNPYKPLQARCNPARAIGKFLPLLLPVLLVLTAYVLFGMLWDTPAPVVGR
jgi:hypothetical protein